MDNRRMKKSRSPEASGPANRSRDGKERKDSIG